MCLRGSPGGRAGSPGHPGAGQGPQVRGDGLQYHFGAGNGGKQWLWHRYQGEPQSRGPRENLKIHEKPILCWGKLACNPKDHWPFQTGHVVKSLLVYEIGPILGETMDFLLCHGKQQSESCGATAGPEKSIIGFLDPEDLWISKNIDFIETLRTHKGSP